MMLPDFVRHAPKDHPGACVISVREVACNDPNCAPIDTIVEFLFRSELRGMVGLPCEVGEVREATIDEDGWKSPWGMFSRT